MLVRELKLKPNKSQEEQLNTMLFQCTGLHNLILRRIKQDAKNKIYHTKYSLFNQFAGHSKKTDLHSRTIQAVIEQAYLSWDRCFKKIAKEPKLKSIRNQISSISFPDPIKRNKITNKIIRIPLIGKTRYYAQILPEGNIKTARVIKRASGWYIQLNINAKHQFTVKDTQEKVGIDTGFTHLAVLSNGTKIENPRNYIRGQKRLAQAQKGLRKRLVSRLHERIKNRRKDYNHKVSRKIIEDYSEIYITKDNLRNQSKIFGKSVSDAGISQLRNFLIYKGENHGRKVKLVDSKNSTMTCSDCGALTGPTGLSGLAVRQWGCVCGTLHDRDINSARVTLNVGLGINLVLGKELRSLPNLNRNPTDLSVGGSILMEEK